MIHAKLKKLPLALAVAAAMPLAAADLQLSGQQPTIASGVASPGEFGKAGESANTYIVELVGDPVATYDGGIQGLKATSNKATGANRLDTNSKDSKAYRKHLKGKQADFKKSAGISSRVSQEFQVVLNGMAVQMTEAEAEAMAARPDVKRVTKERIEVLNTDVGPEWINADSIWGGPPNNVNHSQGEGLVIAVLDSGINHDHPSFADIGGDGYDHTNPLGSGNYLPGSYCDTIDASFCNDKLIGAWSFVPGDANYPSPEDSDGHGSHTASTAGGNVIPAATTYAPTTSLTRAISGVAPHANIIAYDVCIDGCPGAALIAAVEQVVIDAATLPDGIHALNYSISGGQDPYNDPIEQGFLNATAAGVYVSASAGNNGPGAATLGHQSPWIATTAAATHTRLLENSLVDMSADGSSLPDITSVGFTSGYGPAPIVHAGDFPTNNGSSNDTQPDQCLEPFPPGHFSGEIVICDRGAIARVAKGANVLAGGAGGFVLANLAAQGESVVGDAHFLPAVHVGASDGDALRSWVAGASNPMATITGYQLNVADGNADVTAGFSSRGPNTAVDVIKPDVTAPGVSVLAAVDTVDPTQPPEYDFISGTSMSSPHHAGAGAIVSGARPDWTPYEVKSAIMMTSVTDGVRKEDGVTPADPFDMGAGRVDLSRAQEAGLVLSETPANFAASDPALGGDPKTLNVASMMDSACVGECSWTRTFTNVERHTIHMDLSAYGSGDAGFSVSPSSLKVKGGQTGTIHVTANTLGASSGWQFGQVDAARRGDGPDLHLPIAVQAANTTAPGVFGKSVDKTDDVVAGDLLTYTISIVNGQLAGQIDLTDHIPGNVTPVAGSETEVVTGGVTSSPFSINGNTASWSGSLDQGGMDVVPFTSAFGYIPMSIFVPPFGCPSNCDDGAWIVNVNPFNYNGNSYSQVILSVNGTLEAGVASSSAAPPSNSGMPSGTPPNNLLAPFWTDLDLGADGDGAEWYVASLSAGSDNFTVFEWNNVPRWGDPSQRYTFQIWIWSNAPQGADNIWYVYADVGGSANPATVGAENFDGSVGSSYYFDGAGTEPAVGTDLAVRATQGGTATFTFQAEVDSCDELVVNKAEIDHDDGTDKAIAVSNCAD